MSQILDSLRGKQAADLSRRQQDITQALGQGQLALQGQAINSGVNPFRGSQYGGHRGAPKGGRRRTKGAALGARAGGMPATPTMYSQANGYPLASDYEIPDDLQTLLAGYLGQQQQHNPFSDIIG